jgi:hypothetical protein
VIQCRAGEGLVVVEVEVHAARFTPTPPGVTHRHDTPSEGGCAFRRIHVSPQSECADAVEMLRYIVRGVGSLRVSLHRGYRVEYERLGL